MLSLLIRPKVILLSGGHCNITESVLNVSLGWCNLLDTVKPELTTTCQQRPLFWGPKGGRTHKFDCTSNNHKRKYLLSWLNVKNNLKLHNIANIIYNNSFN